MRIESRRRQLPRPNPRRLPAQAREPEGIAQPLGRIDGDHRRIEIRRRPRQRQRRRDRRLADSAGPQQYRNRSFGEQVFQESAPSKFTISGQPHISLLKLPVIDAIESPSLRAK